VCNAQAERNKGIAKAAPLASPKRILRFNKGFAGLDSLGIQHKADIIQQALDKHKDISPMPLTVLQYLGGFEIAALTGAYMAAAQQQLPILVDGFICSVAALVAVRINPA
jgi:nicotinate-nucleotide--dimethylbenzimidazole phosphoribosyltransferase